jgi:outer membrane receptor for ferrienterochelin and colicins
MKISHILIIFIYLIIYYNPSVACNASYDNELGWLQEVEVASGYNEPLTEVPVPVTVINSQMITNIGAKTLKDVLITYVPGITFVQDQNEVNIAGRGVYGSSQQKMLILLNGHRLNSRSYSMANPDYSISLEKVKCIEVLRAPGSSLYGNVALSAVINIITKKGSDVNGVQFSAGIGNYGQKKFSFLLGNEFENEHSDLLLWANWYQSDGEQDKETSAILDGFKDKGAYDVGMKLKLDNFNFLVTQRYAKYIEPFSGGGITGESYNYNDYSKLAGTGPGLGSKFSHIGIDYNTKLYEDLDFKLQVYYDQNDVNAHLVINPQLQQHLFGGWSERSSGFIAQLNKPYYLYGHKGTWMVGIQEDRMELYDSQVVTGIDGGWFPTSNQLLEAGKENISSVFTQIKHQFSEQLIGNFGIRFDNKQRYKDDDINAISPRLALIYIPNNNFDIKVSYSKAFVDAPYWYRYNTLPSYRGAQSLQPEYMESYQFTPSLKFADGKVLNRLNLFYNKFTDFIWRKNNAAANEPLYQNAGFLKVWGIENETSYRERAYNIAFNFTYQAAHDAENYSILGEQISDVPNWAANLVFNINPLELMNFNSDGFSPDLWFNFTARYIGKQISPIDITYPNGRTITNPHNEVDDVILFNSGFRWQWQDMFLDARVYNLLDEDYYQGGSVTHPYPQPGRWFMFTVGYKGEFL